jgi:hypothetical protein
VVQDVLRNFALDTDGLLKAFVLKPPHDKGIAEELLLAQSHAIQAVEAQLISVIAGKHDTPEREADLNREVRMIRRSFDRNCSAAHAAYKGRAASAPHEDEVVDA